MSGICQLRLTLHIMSNFPPPLYSIASCDKSQWVNFYDQVFASSWTGSPGGSSSSSSSSDSSRSPSDLANQPTTSSGQSGSSGSSGQTSSSSSSQQQQTRSPPEGQEDEGTPATRFCYSSRLSAPKSSS